MSLATYGVDAAVVMKYLPQWQVSGNTLPGQAELDAGGEFLETAAADVLDALLEGGFGEPTATTSTNPKAYWIIHRAIAQLAALNLATAHRHLFDADDLAKMWATTKNKLNEFRTGERIGEITITSSTKRSRFQHGLTTRTEIDDVRISYLDHEL